MRIRLKDRKGFFKNESIEEWKKEIYVAVQTGCFIHTFMYCDENMNHFTKNNHEKVKFVYKGRTPKGTLLYEEAQDESKMQ